MLQMPQAVVDPGASENNAAAKAAFLFIVRKDFTYGAAISAYSQLLGWLIHYGQRFSAIIVDLLFLQSRYLSRP